ncbi:MAG: DarT ssDNA thymidine ADP-ribosyltransferase family protein [Candidatus Acidiferrales bacterium]
MQRSEIKELHYITPIANIPSIIVHGILCKNRADQFDPATIALQTVQDTRDKKSVPGGLPLHDYANLYFSARNPMMYKRQALHREICVLQVSTDVLDQPKVVIAELVPRSIPSNRILGAYVSCEHSKAALEATGFAPTITIDGHIFFRG